MNYDKQIEEARQLHEAACDRLDEQAKVIRELPDDSEPEVLDFNRALADKYEHEAELRADAVKRLVSISRARKDVPPADTNEVEERGGEKWPTGFVKVDEPHTYRQDNNTSGERSFFADMYAAAKGDGLAQERLARHSKEVRDVTTADPGAGVFLPPNYLSQLLAEFPRERRPFADALPKLPLPDAGISLTVPRVTTATTTAIQASENAAVSETDIDGTLLTVGVNTIAGQNDVSLRALERTMPGMDFLIFQDLQADYDEQLDTQCIAGTGASQQHLGIRAVSGTNAVTYTDATPTAAELVPKVYDAIQRVTTNRKEPANAIVIHPTRAAWLASNLSSTFPLFQLGVLTQAAGTQQAGFVDNFAGLRVIIDSNIVFDYGASTDQDEVYVVRLNDLYLMEGPLRFRVFPDVLSGTLQVRLQVVAFSAFISGRQPTAISIISGTGLKGATF